MYKIRHIALGLLVFASIGAFSQIHEIGVWGGITNYFGDLNTKASFKMVRPGTGVFYRYNINDRTAWRTTFSWGQAEFADRVVNEERNQQRNLSFKTDIYDLSTWYEFNFFSFDKNKKKEWWTPYIASGLSVFFFNPKGLYRGQWYYLQPLGTEGQNDPSYSGVKKYRPFSFAIPFVAGFKFSIKRNWTIAVEGGLRQTFTDYLDDVSGKYPSYVSLPGGSGGLAAALSDRSAEVTGERTGTPGRQRGESPQKDMYLFGGITISYTIMPLRCPTISGGHTYR